MRTLTIPHVCTGGKTFAANGWLSRPEAYVRIDGSDRLRVNFCRDAMRIVDTTTQLAYSGSHTSTEDTWYDVYVRLEGSSIELWRGERSSAMEKVFDIDTVTTTATTDMEFRGVDGSLLIDNVQIHADGLSNTTTYLYNDANELTSMTDRNGSMSFGFDGWGRMTSKSQAGHSATYSYRYGSKLHAVTSGFPDEADVTYETGGDGKRRSRTQGTDETWYNWDGRSLIISEEDDADGSSGSLRQSYFYGLGYTIAQFMGSDPANPTARHYLVHDYLESTRAMFDQSLSKVAEFTFTPFGRLFEVNAANITGVLYRGYLLDSILSEYYGRGPKGDLGNYLPALGRWRTCHGNDKDCYTGSRDNPLNKRNLTLRWVSDIVKDTLVAQDLLDEKEEFDPYQVTAMNQCLFDFNHPLGPLKSCAEFCGCLVSDVIGNRTASFWASCTSGCEEGQAATEEDYSGGSLPTDSDPEPPESHPQPGRDTGDNGSPAEEPEAPGNGGSGGCKKSRGGFSNGLLELSILYLGITLLRIRRKSNANTSYQRQNK